MHQTPYLLLDIDGVLIPFPATDGSTPTSHTRHLVRTADIPDPFAIWLNPDHGKLITDAIRSDLVRPVWCTSWRFDARRIIAPLLGLPDFDHIELPNLPITTSHPDGYLWKRNHVADWLASGPAVWIDDDFTPLDHRWAADRTAFGNPTLLIQPDPNTGIQPEHVINALEWAASLTTTKQAA
ncbi:HAD domain-containing protein [Kitasatospora sp. NBC_01287]|uniref:HAD domain-containing protein n=1 Tax=Kitasatospora sp. NBC_01287 TaxID=2903573 RepID=UPI002254CB1C|nr:HAD domain-containing protein [Kitasatospora sp. NBC_01287]MCX4750014.1 HAD domain-containing protein [Kitasatospora sp. NBC_01287]